MIHIRYSGAFDMMQNLNLSERYKKWKEVNYWKEWHHVL